MRSANELLMLADMLASISSLTLNGNVPLRKHIKTRMSLKFSSMRCECWRWYHIGSRGGQAWESRSACSMEEVVLGQRERAERVKVLVVQFLRSRNAAFE